MLTGAPSPRHWQNVRFPFARSKSSIASLVDSSLHRAGVIDN